MRRQSHCVAGVGVTDEPPIPSLGACRGAPAIPLTGARPECECVLCGAVVAAGANQEGWFREMCEENER